MSSDEDHPRGPAFFNGGPRAGRTEEGHVLAPTLHLADVQGCASCGDPGGQVAVYQLAGSPLEVPATYRFAGFAT